MAHITGLYRRQKTASIYMETSYPVLRQVVFSATKQTNKHLVVKVLNCENYYALNQLNKNSFFFFCSMFSLLFLHFFLYGCNIFAWKKTRINYSFIFELSQTKELKYRDVFLICTTSMTMVVGVMFVHLGLLAKGYSYTQVQAIPGLLLLVNSVDLLVF